MFTDAQCVPWAKQFAAVCVACVNLLLQDILQAALHIETDLRQQPIAPVFRPPSVVNNQPCPEPKNITELCSGSDSRSLDVGMQCSDNYMPATSSGTTNFAVDMTTAFCLSQDDFAGDIDDLSFMDLPMRSETRQDPRVSMSVTSSCHTNVAIDSASSALTDVTSNHSRLQLSNVCDMETLAVNGTKVCSPNPSHSTAASGRLSRGRGKYVLHSITVVFCLTSLACCVAAVARYVPELCCQADCVYCGGINRLSLLLLLTL